MKKSLRIFYFHPPIRNKSWLTRRARILEKKVRAVWMFAIPYGEVAVGSLMIRNEIAGSVTTGTVTFSEISEDVLSRIENFLCCGEFHAEVLTPQKVSDIIKSCHAETEQHQPLPAP